MCQRVFVCQDGLVFAVVQYLPVPSFDVMWNFIDKLNLLTIEKNAGTRVHRLLCLFITKVVLPVIVIVVYFN